MAILCGIPSLLIVMSSFSEQMDLFSGGWNLQALFYAFGNQLCVWVILLFSVSIREAHWNKPMPLVQKLSTDSYAAYFIHPVVVVGCIFVMELLPVSPLLRLALVCVVGIPCCFIAARGVRLVLGTVGVKM